MMKKLLLVTGVVLFIAGCSEGSDGSAINYNIELYNKHTKKEEMAQCNDYYKVEDGALHCYVDSKIVATYSKDWSYSIKRVEREEE